jgi:hypothetical protein
MRVVLTKPAVRAARKRAEADKVRVEVVDASAPRRQLCHRPALSGTTSASPASTRSIALETSANEDGRLYGYACGEVLSYIVALRTYHPGSDPSFNRACHLMRARAKKEGRLIPAERRHTTMWGEWGGIAPTWAASSRFQTALPRGTTYDIHDRQQRQTVLSWANTLTDWACEFSAVGSSKPLLSRAKAIHYLAANPADDLAIPSLSAQQLSWAASYKVRP